MSAAQTALPWLYRAVLLGMSTLLLACAVPEWQKPGSPQAEIERNLGRPTAIQALPEGGTRWLYSRQPSGQQVYHLDFDAQHRLLRVQQVLTEARFQALRNDVDTRATVLAQFGPPALVEQVALFTGDIWTYRILENNIARQAHVHLDPAGVVRRVMFTDEIRPDFDHEL